MSTPDKSSLPDMHKLLREVHSRMFAGALDCDQLPTGHGEFGLSVTNPIPTKGVAGSNEYLSSLRTLAGKPVQYRRIGSVRAPEHVTTAIIDKYQVMDGRNNLCQLYLCPYHLANSKKIPEGFGKADA